MCLCVRVCEGVRVRVSVSVCVCVPNFEDLLEKYDENIFTIERCVGPV